MPSTFAAGLRPRTLVLALALLPIAASAAWWRALSEDRTAARRSDGPIGVPVAVAPVERRDVPHWIASIGTVQSLHTVVVRPQVTGIVTEVLFTEGQLVERGALLARIDSRNFEALLAQAEAEKASREAQLRAALRDLERYRSLVEQHVISRQALDQQVSLVEQLEAAIKASEAIIAAQRVQLSYTRITSPVRGRVGIRRVDPGNLVQAGDAEGIVTVTQIDPISIVFTLPQELLPRVHAAMQDRKGVRVTALERESGAPLAEGRLTSFDNQIDPATGTLRLRAQFDNPDALLWPGQFVTLRLEVGVSRDALVVPARAVRHGLNGPYVYRITDAKAELVPVVPEYQNDEIVVVASGLDAGDLVVIDGHSRLAPGTAVEIHGMAGESHVTGI